MLQNFLIFITAFVGRQTVKFFCQKRHRSASLFRIGFQSNFTTTHSKRGRSLIKKLIAQKSSTPNLAANFFLHFYLSVLLWRRGVETLSRRAFSKARGCIWMWLGGSNARFEPRLFFSFSLPVLSPECYPANSSPITYGVMLNR
jgi:hypothetical protein